MANFGQLVLTNAGLQAQVLAQGGEALEFSRIKMGDGTFNGNISSLSDLVSTKADLGITKGYMQNGAYVLETIFANDEITTGFYWREIGVFIKDSNGNNILYAYANAGNNYDYIPATQDEKYTKSIRVATAVGNASNITITENEGLVFVDTLTFNTALDEVNKTISQKENELYQGFKIANGNSYAGIASDAGIDIGLIKGKSVQDAEPTPDNPQDIHSFGDNTVNFHSHGFQLFDASKLATKSGGGVTITNNGDGSFTVSGSGTLTGNISLFYSISGERIKSLFKEGKLTFKGETRTYPYLHGFFGLDDGTRLLTFNQDSTVNITQEILERATIVTLIFYGASGEAIKTGTIKPMLYQDGDGTWEEYNSFDTAVTLAEPLRSLPNGVHDTYRDGVITRRVGASTYDGSSDEVWAENVGAYYIAVPEKKSRVDMAKGAVLCSRFKERNSNTSAALTNRGELFEGFYTTGNQNVFVDYDGCAGGVGNFKTWLASNPITILYELATPITETVELPTIPSSYPHAVVGHDSTDANLIEWNVLQEQAGIKKQLGGYSIRIVDAVPDVQEAGVIYFVRKVDG